MGESLTFRPHMYLNMNHDLMTKQLSQSDNSSTPSLILGAGRISPEHYLVNGSDAA